MNKEHGTITYPVSVRYRANWSDWESIREIMQNAMDSDAEVEMDFDTHNKELIVRDHGDGFELKHLLIGETTKDGEATIGKFGEGLKFALLALVRNNRTCTVRTNNLVIVPRLVEMFGQKTLAITWKVVKNHFPGTEVRIKGVPRSFRERFLSLNKEENMINKVLTNMPGQLFVKGIFVKEIDSIAGYNVCIERENPLDGSVNDWDVQYKIADLILGAKDATYMFMLLQELKENPHADKVEFRCGSYNDWQYMTAIDLWKETAHKVFGPKVCLMTNSELFQEVKRDGYSVINTPAHFPKGFIETDLDVVRARGGTDYEPTKFGDLPPTSLQNLGEASYLIKQCISFEPAVVTVGHFLTEPNVMASTTPKKGIKLAIKALTDLPELILILAEEQIHFATGSRDLTPTHESYMNDLLRTVLKKLIGGYKLQCPDEWIAKFIENDEAQ